MKNIAVYCRFSSTSGGADSLIQQWEEGKAYCERRGYNPIKYDEGGGVSGHARIEERKVGNRLIADIKARKIQGVYLKEMTRLVRNDIEGLEFRDIALEYEIVFIENGNEYDLRDRNSALTFAINNAQADINRRDTVYKLQLGLIRAFERGELAKGKLLYGYTKEKKRGGGYQVIVDSKQASILRKIMKRFLKPDVKTLKDMVSICIDDYSFERSHMWYSVLFNKNVKKYAGEWYEWYSIEPLSEEKKAYKIEADAIISNTLCKQVMDKAERMRLTKYRFKDSSRRNIFSGSVFCGECGRILVRNKLYRQVYEDGKATRYDKVIEDKDGNPRYKFHCIKRSKNRLQGYDNKGDYKHTTSIQEDAYIRLMKKVIQYTYEQSQILRSEYRASLELDTDSSVVDNEIEYYEERIQKIRTRRNKLNKMFQSGVSGMSFEEWEKESRDIQEEISRCEREIAVLIESNNDTDSVEDVFNWKEQYLAKYSFDNISEMSDEEFEKLYNELIDKVLIRGNTKAKSNYLIEVTFKFKVVGDSFVFDKEEYRKWRRDNPNSSWKLFKKKFKVVEGKSTLSIGLEKGEVGDEMKDVNISSKLLEFILISLLYEVDFCSENDMYVVDFIQFNPMLPNC